MTSFKIFHFTVNFTHQYRTQQIVTVARMFFIFHFLSKKIFCYVLENDLFNGRTEKSLFCLRDRK